MPPNNQARIARLGAYALHATHDTLEVSAPGRKAAAAKLDEVLLAKIDADAPGLATGRTPAAAEVCA
jgi:hypothetical protein